MISRKTVNVERPVIRNAIRGNSHKCMIADAIHAKVKWAKFISVDTQSIRFSNLKTGRRFIYLTPPEAQKALLDFDRGRKVQPFAFTLTQGYTRKMRVRSPGYKPISSRNYKRNPNRYMPAIHREFGLRAIVRQAGAKGLQ